MKFLWNNDDKTSWCGLSILFCAALSGIYGSDRSTKDTSSIVSEMNDNASKMRRLLDEQIRLDRIPDVRERDREATRIAGEIAEYESKQRALQRELDSAKN